ncbi:MAG: FAD-dependent oxidoreductase, partial [Deltaproteobacteria bacterium]|nr:FAD-dependent oxidoreductase [Deltaproteobacteria bacterium]
VGIPTMSRVVRHLSAGLEVRTERRIAELHPNGDGVELVDVDGTPAGTFAAVAVAIPAPQAAGLLAPALPELATALERVRMAPCWAAMVELAEPAGVDFDAAEIADGALRWLSNDGSKPGRSGRTWVAHASPEFSRQHLEASPEQVGDRLADEVRRWLNRAAIADLRVHRWRYALCEQPLGRSHIFEPASGVGIAGDWCIGGRIEAAYDSGRALGEALANRR